VEEEEKYTERKKNGKEEKYEQAIKCVWIRRNTVLVG